jgi:hypothetical protein
LGNRTGAYWVLVGSPEEKKTLENLRRRWENNIQIAAKKWDGEAWTGWIWLRTGTAGSRFECGNELSGFIKSGEFLV